MKIKSVYYTGNNNNLTLKKYKYINVIEKLDVAIFFSIHILLLGDDTAFKF